MSYQEFIISDFESGLFQNKAPWLLPQDAFQEINNGYIKDGKIKKRSGRVFLAEMVHQQTTITNISAANPAVITVASAVGLANDLKIQISYATGGTYPSLKGIPYIIKGLVGLTFSLYELDGVTPVDTSAFGVYGGSGVLCIFPALPIMGIKQFVRSSTDKITCIWDTKRMGVYNPDTNAIDPIDTTDIFTGDNSSFISVGYFGKTAFFSTPTLYFTNYNGDPGISQDKIRYYQTGITTTVFEPVVEGGNTVVAAQYVFSKNGRLCLFNTVETGNVTYPQRERWSKLFNPDPALWDSTIPGQGGFVDAATSDALISMKELSDRVIVFFSNSTWKSEPTNDPALPFRWTKINDFRSTDAPQSTMGYDRFVISMGQRGIFATDGIEAKRIDDKIYEYIVNNVNLNSIEKMYSERNYVDMFSWTLYPSSTNTTSSGVEQISSDSALIRSESNGSFSVYDLSIADNLGVLQNMSVLGFGSANVDAAPEDFTGNPNEKPDWACQDFGDENFLSYFIEENSDLFLGGDQIGRLFIMDTGASDNGAEIPFSIRSASWNPFKDQGVKAQFGYIDIYADADVNTKLEISFYKDDMDNPYRTAFTHLLPKIGFLASIQNIQNTSPCIIEAWDHGLSTGDTVYIYALEGISELTGGPYIITNIGQGTFSLDNVDATAYSAYIDGGQVTENGFMASKCWKRIYAGGIGYTHSIKISSSGQDQVLTLDAFKLGFRTAGKRMTS